MATTSTCLLVTPAVVIIFRSPNLGVAIALMCVEVGVVTGIAAGIGVVFGAPGAQYAFPSLLSMCVGAAIGLSVPLCAVRVIGYRLEFGISKVATPATDDGSQPKEDQLQDG